MDSKWERIQPYIKLNSSMLHRMMSPVKPSGKIKKVNLIRKGLRNSNYCVEYEENKFLLRIYGTDDNWWEKEKSVFEHVKDKVSVPELLYLDTEFSVIHKPYAVFEYINGPTLDEYLQKEAYNNNVISEIGQSLALIHETSYNQVGFFNESLNVTTVLPPLKSWYDMFLTENVAQKLGKKLTENLQTYIENNAENIKRIDERVAFVHNDFRPINIMVANNHRPYFIDWEGAMAGHVFGDIGQFLRFNEQITPQNENSFIDNYNYYSKNKLPCDYRDLAKLRDLVNLLQLLNCEHNLRNKDGDLIRLIRSTCSCI
jgi:aminoglycoside phosphotransferase (APT) family kinase protein